MKRSVVFAAARTSAGRETKLAAAEPAMKFRRLNILRLSLVPCAITTDVAAAPTMRGQCGRWSGRTMAAPMLYSAVPFLRRILLGARRRVSSQPFGNLADDDPDLAQKRFRGARQRPLARSDD